MRRSESQAGQDGQWQGLSWKTKALAWFTALTVTASTAWAAMPPFAKNVLASWAANHVPVLFREPTPILVAGTPQPSVPVPVVFGNIFGVQFHCPSQTMKHRIEAFANVHGLREGETPWFFARAEENRKYYPSAPLNRDQGGTYEGAVYVGRGQVFRLFLVVLNKDGAELVRKYLSASKADDKWSSGMEEIPNWNPLTHLDVHRSTCKSS